MRRMGSVTAPGIAQATYDAAVAAQAAAEAKLVAVGSWVELASTITAKCAGAATSDPDSLAAGLTVTTTTGTFNSETVTCNQFNWTTHASTNDGWSETLNYDLGTVASLLTGYDPATYGVQIVADLVAVGTLNGTNPLIALIIAPSGSAAPNSPGAGWAIYSTTSAAAMWVVSTGNHGSEMTAQDPTSVLARVQARWLPTGFANRSHIIAMTAATSTTPSKSLAYDNSGPTFATTDKFLLLIGSNSSTAAAVSGLKIRFRARIVPWANLDLSDLDLGCQA